MDKLSFQSKTAQLAATSSETIERIVIEADTVSVFYRSVITLDDGTVLSGGTSVQSKRVSDMPDDVQAAFELVASDPSAWLDFVPKVDAVAADAVAETIAP